MSLERSSTNFRVYEFEAKLTDESLAGFAENALPPFKIIQETFAKVSTLLIFDGFLQ